MGNWLNTIGERSSLFVLFSMVSMLSLAQKNDTLNNTDENGKKQGYWIIWGEMKPEKGYAAGTKIEEGLYKDDRKNGIWTKYHKDGLTPRLKGTYANNRPNGEYWKYYEDGRIMEHGTFIGGKQKQLYERYYHSGCVEIECLDTIINYYKDNCGGENIGELDMSFKAERCRRIYEQPKRPQIIYPGDIKEVISYDTTTTKKYEPNDVQMKGPPQKEAPDPLLGHVKNGEFKANGYNKLFTPEDEYYMDGEFKNGKLWNGKHYIYDSDGILLKIKIYKNGKYHSDGHL